MDITHISDAVQSRSMLCEQEQGQNIQNNTAPKPRAEETTVERKCC